MKDDEAKNIRPLNGLVLVKVDEHANERPGSPIILTDAAKGRPTRGHVMALSKGYFQNAHLIEPSVIVGEFVIFDAYKIVQVLADGQLAKAQGTPIAKPGEYMLIHEHHILAVIDPEEDTDE